MLTSLPLMLSPFWKSTSLSPSLPEVCFPPLSFNWHCSPKGHQRLPNGHIRQAFLISFSVFISLKINTTKWLQFLELHKLVSIRLLSYSSFWRFCFSTFHVMKIFSKERTNLHLQVDPKQRAERRQAVESSLMLIALRRNSYIDPGQTALQCI